MDDVLFARGQMAMSLAFHIVFAAIGVAMPLLMVLAEWRYRRTLDPDYLSLARSWAAGPCSRSSSVCCFPGSCGMQAR